MKKIALFLIVLIYSSTYLIADDDNAFHWPREIAKKSTTVTLYQPQYDSFKENILEGRMALSVTAKDKDPVFGALFFKARLATDLEERTAVLEKIDIERVVFPGIEDTSRIGELTTLLVDEIESWDVVMSLDRIAASLSDVEDLKALSVQLNNDPPEIYFRTTPSVLVSIDGEPIQKEIENSDFEYVINTAFFIVKYKSKPVVHLGQI